MLSPESDQSSLYERTQKHIWNITWLAVAFFGIKYAFQQCYVPIDRAISEQNALLCADVSEMDQFASGIEFYIPGFSPACTRALQNNKALQPGSSLVAQVLAVKNERSTLGPADLLDEFCEEKEAIGVSCFEGISDR